jgi:SAM-dependent methyltransferase
LEKATAITLAWRSETGLAQLETASADRLLAFSPTEAELTEALRVLKPGGIAVISFPARRAPNLETAAWRIVKKQFVSDKMPLPGVNPHEFADFWNKTLSPAERQKWAWASALFANVFNSVEDTADAPHTALYVLEKA